MMVDMEKKILVVDDDGSIRDVFQTAFTDSGCNVFLAENAEQALRVLEEHDIELIFLDLKLFGMNGIDLCRQIKKKNSISVIYAMTGWTGLFEVLECREAGFDDYFTKPIPLDLLSKAVDDAFEKLSRWKMRYPSG
jgi:DNA-binding response OmpR family regulator